MKFSARYISILFILSYALLVSPLTRYGVVYAAKKAATPKPQRVTSEGLTSVVTFAAQDSVIYNFDRRSMELWGKARLDHERAQVTAPKIVIDGTNSLLHAFGTSASAQTPAEPAVFGDQQGILRSDIITYNFQTRVGETAALMPSFANGIYFKGKKVSKLDNGNIVVKDGTFTTCDEEEPHYWFSASSMTLLPDKSLKAKSLVMYIHPEIFAQRLPAIPVMALPYMKWSSKRERISGFLTPTITTYSSSLALSKFGYYWAMSDYADLNLEADLALNGSWRLGKRFRYLKNDAFSGTMTGDYKRYAAEEGRSAATDWNAAIAHHQALDASSQLDVALQFQGGKRDDDLHAMNVESVLTEQTNARASVVKTFQNDNSLLTATYNRSADLRNNNSYQRIESTFYQNRLYPFRAAVESWTSAVSVTTGASLTLESLSLNERVSSGYSGYLNGELGYYRELGKSSKALFTQGISLQSMEPVPGSKSYSGTRILLPLRMQSTLFQHLNLNPSLTYSHSLQTDGAESFSTTVFSVDASTRLYGTLGTGALEKLVGMKALRHTFIPTLSYTWNPAFAGEWEYASSLSSVYDWPTTTAFSGFEATRFTGLPDGQRTVGLTLKNLFHGKFNGSSTAENGDASTGDYTAQLLSLTASTSYNSAAEACPLAPLSIVASSNVVAPNVLLSGGAMYDFYSYDSATGARANRTNHDEGKPPLRFVKGFMNMSVSMHGSTESGSVASYATALASPFATYTEQALFLNPFLASDWQMMLSLFMQTDNTNPLAPASDKLLNIAAKIALSKNWQSGITTGYDFERNKMVFPMVQLYRDLHCWKMGLQLVPSGVFQGITFQLGLKALSNQNPFVTPSSQVD